MLPKKKGLPVANKAMVQPLALTRETKDSLSFLSRKKIDFGIEETKIGIQIGKPLC